MTRIALIGLSALLPAFAFAENPKPYVVYQGRAVRAGRASPAAAHAVAAPGGEAPNTMAVRQVSAFGTGSFRPGISGGRAYARPSAAFSRAFRGSSHRRGAVGSRSSAASDDAPPAYATPGAKILSAGQQPVYTQAAGGGTHSVEGGGFIALDQAKAHDVGRGPGISWAPPDTPPSASRMNSGGGGTGASANGPAPAGGGGGSNGPVINVNNGNTNGNQGGGNGRQDDSTGFNPAF